MIHVGIMGLGQIAHRVAKGICYAENAELYAVGSRSLEKAGEFQRLYGAQKIYDSYERLLQDPQVEMVYRDGIYMHTKSFAFRAYSKRFAPWKACFM